MTTGKQISAKPASLAAAGRPATRFTGLPNKPPPRRLDELGETEAMVLRCLRHWLAGFQHQDHLAWSMAWNDLAGSLGAQRARLALTALTGLVRALCGHRRRIISYHQPCCPCLGADELSVLSLIADCQSDASGETAHLRAAWLVTPAGVPTLVAAARRFSDSLGEHELRIAGRQGR